MATLADVEGRAVPATVYPAAGGAGAWVVEAPADGPRGGGDHRTFTGVRALERALEFAHQAYGSVQVLSH